MNTIVIELERGEQINGKLTVPINKEIVNKAILEDKYVKVLVKELGGTELIYAPQNLSNPVHKVVHSPDLVNYYYTVSPPSVDGFSVQEYQDIVSQTAIYPQEVENFGYAYTFFGLMGELDEVAEKFAEEAEPKAIIKEVGDVYWYMNAMCNEFQINLLDVIYKVDKDTLNSVFIDTSITESIRYFLANTPPKWSEKLKKFYRDDKPLDVTFIKNMLIELNKLMNGCLYVINCSLDQCLQANYEKLIARRVSNTLSGDGDNREETIIQ